MISDLAIHIGRTVQTIFTNFSTKTAWSEGNQQKEYQKHLKMIFSLDSEIVEMTEIVRVLTTDIREIP